MAELKVSGERMVEDGYVRSLGGYVIYIMHVATYRYVESICIGKNVLDLGCGSGYGAAFLADVANSVVGVDVDGEAVEFASKRYGRPNLQYRRVEAGRSLPFPDAEFDVVLSFQVIEHVEDDEAYVREAYRVLKNGGVFVVVTPDRKHRLLPWQKPWNRWHLREYSSKGLVDLVGRVFSVESVLKMSAPWAVARVELNRYRLTKWLMLPVTLPFVPEFLRIFALDLLHSMRGKTEAICAEAPAAPPAFDFDETMIAFEPNPSKSLNLMVSGRKLERVRQ